MENKRSGAWLSKQIDAAQKNIDTWPSWMQKAARFEGNDLATQSGNKTRVVCQIEKHATK